MLAAPSRLSIAGRYRQHCIPRHPFRPPPARFMAACSPHVPPGVFSTLKDGLSVAGFPDYAVFTRALADSAVSR